MLPSTPTLLATGTRTVLRCAWRPATYVTSPLRLDRRSPIWFLPLTTLPPTPLSRMSSSASESLRLSPALTASPARQASSSRRAPGSYREVASCVALGSLDETSPRAAWMPSAEKMLSCWISNQADLSFCVRGVRVRLEGEDGAEEGRRHNQQAATDRGLYTEQTILHVNGSPTPVCHRIDGKSRV